MLDKNSLSFVSENKETIIIAVSILFILLFAWTAYIYYTLADIKKRSRIFFENGKAKDLEEVIYNQIKKTDKVAGDINKLIADNLKISNSLAGCVQKIGMVRFNPFNEVGGNQSFAIALLDNNLNGVMILSLYSRDGVRVYSKSIKEGKSEYKLSKEEEEAMKIACEKE